MSRVITLGVAQLGPIQRADDRASVVARLLELLRQANDRGVTLLVYPELALTTFFPRWLIDDPAERDSYFEREMPGPETQVLFDTARRMRIGFHLGYAELTQDGQHFNTAILVDREGELVGKYRKVHLPGHAEYDPQRTHQHLEKRYFEVGDLGFPVWRSMGGLIGMCICNDRRWPETYRVMGLQGVELVLLGYNTPAANSLGGEAPHLRNFHNHLVMQAGAYQNGCWVAASAKAGVEDDHPLIGDSCIIDPSGEIVAKARTLDDELIVADCDLDAGHFNKTTVFDFAAHRRPEHYGLITKRVGAAAPE